MQIYNLQKKSRKRKISYRDISRLIQESQKTKDSKLFEFVNHRSRHQCLLRSSDSSLADDAKWHDFILVSAAQSLLKMSRNLPFVYFRQIGGANLNI